MQRELRELSRLHQALQAQCQANRQRLGDQPASAAVRAALKKAIAHMERQLKDLELHMERLVEEDDALSTDFKRAKTVKGIGPKTAIVILAEFGDLRRYSRNELVALAGLFPREHSSGTSVRKKPRLAKAGKPSVRAALYMGAMSAIRANPVLRQFAQRLKKHGKTPMQILGAVMRKLLLFVRAVIVAEKDYTLDNHDSLSSQPA